MVGNRNVCFGKNVLAVVGCGGGSGGESMTTLKTLPQGLVVLGLDAV